MSMGGGALQPPAGQRSLRHSLSVIAYAALGRLNRESTTPRNPNPPVNPSQERTPWSSPCPAPRPRQEREKRRPRAPPCGPGPRRHLEIRTRSVSIPEDRVRRMIPVSVCGPGGPEVLSASSLSPIGVTWSIPLWGIRRGFFVIPVIFIAWIKYLGGAGGAAEG